MNMHEYFYPNYEFYLNSITYTHKQKNSQNITYTLNCNDTFNTQLIDDGKLKVTITRKLEFSPDDLYSLSVSFVAVLQIIKESKNDLLSIEDLSKELAADSQFFLPNLMSRISALISSITASYGQPPVITPPIIAPVQNSD